MGSEMCIRDRYLCEQSAAAALCVGMLLLQLAAAACCCCSSSSAGWQKLLLWFIESDSSVIFLFQLELIFMHPLAVLSHLRPRFVSCNTSSVVASMRGAKAGVSPPRRSPACITSKLVAYCILSSSYFAVCGHHLSSMVG